MEDISRFVMQQVSGKIINTVLIYKIKKKKHKTYMDRNCHNVFCVDIYLTH